MVGRKNNRYHSADNHGQRVPSPWSGRRRRTGPWSTRRPSPGSSHRVVKLNLARVLRDLTKLKVLCDMVKGGHHIVVHAFQFIKLFLLDEYETHLASAEGGRTAPKLSPVTVGVTRPARPGTGRNAPSKWLVDGKSVQAWESELSEFSRKAMTTTSFKEYCKAKKAGYLVVLVDEYLTSRTCYACDGRCDKFKMVPQPRPWMRETRPEVLRHGLLRCNNCGKHWNRDRNGSLNIMRCGQAARDNRDRPPCMDRIKIGETKRPAEAIRQAGSEAIREGSLSDLTTQHRVY
ncbi:hypothetical protein BASA81_007409 [Batrachochytrium salamandrivorans]|nr:hypothetical protein BASA81_007409 [Batrachochytrium salamandrivorans]